MPRARYLRKILYRVLPVLVSILLLASIGYTVIDRFHGVSTAAPLNNEEKEAAKAREEERPSPIVEITHSARNIAEFHLFGEIPKAVPKSAPLPVSVPLESTLDLVLHGIIIAPGKEENLAIIADAKGKQSSYSVGSVLSKGVTLKEINDDHVVLHNNNRIETLRMWDVSRNNSQGSGMRELSLTGMNPNPMIHGMPPEKGGRHPRNRRERRSSRQRPPPLPGYPEIERYDRR
uniref:Type IV pilus biogenesis n=1 Tax=Candidatus Kentrum sp. LFY TaxID=2126342 RepID=A0A450WIT5_9GAMM|nr:MAG: Type IV pilus biogenesis [Candidatus Kentron sp. LFY]